MFKCQHWRTHVTQLSMSILQGCLFSLPAAYAYSSMHLELSFQVPQKLARTTSCFGRIKTTNRCIHLVRSIGSRFEKSSRHARRPASWTMDFSESGHYGINPWSFSGIDPLGNQGHVLARTLDFFLFGKQSAVCCSVPSLIAIHPLLLKSANTRKVDSVFF